MNLVNFFAELERRRAYDASLNMLAKLERKK